MARLQEAAAGTSRLEATMKLGLSIFFVPLPILMGGLGGFWLDHYKFNTLPLLVIVGTLLGTVASFAGVCAIITYGHRGETE